MGGRRERDVLVGAQVVDEFAGGGQHVQRLQVWLVGGLRRWWERSAARSVVGAVVRRGGVVGRVVGGAVRIERRGDGEVDGAGDHATAVLHAHAVEGQHWRGPGRALVGEVPCLAHASRHSPRSRGRAGDTW